MSDEPACNREGMSMRPRTRLVLAAILAVTCGCPLAGAPVLRLIYDQGTCGDSGAYSELYYSDFFGAAAQQADNFTLDTDDSSITYVRWYGAYRDDYTGEDTFTIRFYATSGTGVPRETPVRTVAPLTITRSDTAFVFEPGGWALPIYEYTATIPVVALTPGIPYWISILNDTERWLWCTNGSGDEGDSFAAGRSDTSGEWGANGLDYAFQLWSDR